MSKTTDVLQTIRNARNKGDFELVKRLSKRELENPQSDIDALDIMNEVAHMGLDWFLIWINEMKKRSGSYGDKPNELRRIAQQLEDQEGKPENLMMFYTDYMKELIGTDAEEVRNKLLSVDTDDIDIEKAKEAMKKEGL